jgi:hypothetical protein
MDTHASPPRARPAWLPPEGTIAARPAGRWWDAVSVDGPRGWSALLFLTDLAPGGTGPVLCEALGARLRVTFLMPPGATATWDEPGTMALGPATYLTIPGDLDGDHTTGLYWAVPPGTTPEHVNPDLLRVALAATTAGQAP